jgi:hypothetical protein
MPNGFVMELEGRWADDQGEWYCREAIIAQVRERSIQRLSVYCTGDGDASRQALHRAQATLTYLDGATWPQRLARLAQSRIPERIGGRVAMWPGRSPWSARFRRGSAYRRGVAVLAPQDISEHGRGGLARRRRSRVAIAANAPISQASHAPEEQNAGYVWLTHLRGSFLTPIAARSATRHPWTPLSNLTNLAGRGPTLFNGARDDFVSYTRFYVGRMG